MDKQREERVPHVFDSYCRRVLKNAANDYYDELSRRSKHEVLLEDCWDLPYTLDHYVDAVQVYTVFGEEVSISDCAMVEALNALAPDKRMIVLAACCIGLPDRVVAEHMHLVRRTVAYRKSRALLELRRLLQNG